MKKILIIVLCFVFILGFSACGSSSSDEGASGEASAEFDPAALDETLTAVAERDDGKALSGLAVEAIKDGEVAYSFAIGNRYIDPKDESKNKEFTTDSKLRIASVSKTFVAVGIMQLYEQGKIDLDEDISE